MDGQSDLQKGPWSVRVTDPQTDSVKGFVTYLISGQDDSGTFEIRRRYNDFFYLREALHKKWPGLYVPPIPEKKITGNKDQQNIEARKKFFEYFLVRLMKAKHLFVCPITREFLRNTGLDMEKFYQTTTTPRYDDLFTEYRQIFGNVLVAEQSGNLRATITVFQTYLKKASRELKSLKEQIGYIVEARGAFTDHLNHCNSAMLPEYERNVYTEYLPPEQRKDPQLLFVNNPKVQDGVRNLQEVSCNNSFQDCLDLVSYEVLEVEAMEETIAGIEVLENTKRKMDQKLLSDQAEFASLMGGKTTFKSIFSRGNKSEQIQILEKDIPALQKEIDLLAEFLKVVLAAFTLSELPSFKKHKQLQYYTMMEHLSQNELRYLSAYGEFMRSIMEGLDSSQAS